jgi:hypothetical protein
MWDEMYDMAVSAASPSWEVFAERPSSSIMTGRGIMMVQQRLSMSEETIDKDERRMLVSTTSTVYPGMIANGTRESMAFFDPRVLGRRWGGDDGVVMS